LPRLGVNALAVGYSASQLAGCIAVVFVFRRRHGSAHAGAGLGVRFAEAS
jgi:hypothetical protein